MKISTVINYCSNEERFIDDCINSVLEFSTDVVVVVSDHFFDGSSENLDTIQQNQNKNPKAKFLVYEWEEGKPARYWHNYSRLIAAQHIQSNCDWILYLDTDEIVDTTLFKKFIKQIPLKPDINSYKLANYWYFREPYYRADQMEDSVVLVRSAYATNINLNDDYREREQFVYPNTPRRTKVDNTPMIHHYSWERSKEEMLNKVRTWGHNKDKDWASLVEEEFSRPFNGTSFVNSHYTFQNTAMFNKEDLEKINLLDPSKCITNIQSRGFFLLNPGQEHYPLLAHISTLYNNALLYDIGTYRGCSALALSYNKSNTIKSFDTGNFIEMKNTPNNIEWIVGNFMEQPIEEIHSSPFIMLDIDHSGKTEKEILDFLVDNNWHGHLLLDDIHLNNEMKDFWSNITLEKYDITHIGHWSGTGLVIL